MLGPLLEVGADAAAEVDRLADVDDLPGGVFVEVAAGRGGERLELFFERGRNCHDRQSVYPQRRKARGVAGRGLTCRQKRLPVMARLNGERGRLTRSCRTALSPVRPGAEPATVQFQPLSTPHSIARLSRRCCTVRRLIPSGHRHSLPSDRLHRTRERASGRVPPARGSSSLGSARRASCGRSRTCPRGPSPSRRPCAARRCGSAEADSAQVRHSPGSMTVGDQPGIRAERGRRA